LFIDKRICHWIVIVDENKEDSLLSATIGTTSTRSKFSVDVDVILAVRFKQDIHEDFL